MRFSYLGNYAVTTLQVVASGSPGLRLTQSDWLKQKKSATWGIGAIREDTQYQLNENVCQLIADTQALLSSLELGQKLVWHMIYSSLKFFIKNVWKYESKKKRKYIFNSIVNCRSLTHFWLCLFETHVYLDPVN